MARQLGSLTLDLVLKLGGFQQGASKAKREVQGLANEINKSMAFASKALAGFGATLGLGLGLREVIQATAEAARSFAILENAVENNAGAAGKTAEELAGIATELQHVSTFSDEAIQDAQALLLTFQSIRGDNFDRATQSVLDLATRLGKDLPSAALLVGKALEDPIKGMNQLARAGVVLSPTQKALIKDLIDVGKAAEAQGIILGALEAKFQGAALAARDNFAGALTGLKNDFENLLELKGGLPEATAQINELSDLLADPRTKNSVDALSSSFLNLATSLLKVVAADAQVPQRFFDLLREPSAAKVFDFLFRIELKEEKDVDKQIEALQKKLDIAKNTEILIDPQLKAESIRKLEAKLEELKKTKVEIPVVFTRFEDFAAAQPTIGGPEAPEIGLSESQLDALDKIIEASKDARERVEEDMRLLKLGFEKGVVGADEFKKAYASLQAQLEKRTKAPTLTEAQQAIKSAGDTVAQFIDRLEEQAATFDQGQAAALRYAVTQGDVGKALDLLGKKGEEARQKILGLIEVTDRQAATKAIQDQIDAFEEEAATINLTAAELIEYRIAHGDLAEVLGRTAEEQAKLTDKLRESAAAAREARAEAERRSEGKALFEATRTDAERFALELERLQELLASNDVSADTFGRSVARSVAAMHDGGSAAKDYRDQLEELNAQLASGAINEEVHAQAVAEAARIREEAHAEEVKAFTEEAMKASQQAMADFLFDPFAEGVEGMVEGFADALRRIAANIVAQDLAERIFEGFEDGFAGIRDQIGGLFGGIGATPPFVAPGSVSPIQTSLAGFDPRQAALPDLAGAGAETAAATAFTAAGTAAATALTTAGTASATALTGAGTATATAFTTAITTGATALTTAGTAVAAAITAAGTAAATAIAGAAGAAGGTSALGVLGNFVGPREQGGFVPPGKVALVGDSRSGRVAPELLLKGRADSAQRASFLAAVTAPASRAPAPGRASIVGLSPDGRQRPQLAFGGATGITVVPLRDHLRERFMASTVRDARHVERLVDPRSAALPLPDDEDRFAGWFAAGGYIPPHHFGVVGDGRGGRKAPELLIAGRASPAYTRGAVMAPHPVGARSAIFSVATSERPALLVPAVSSHELREIDRIREIERRRELASISASTVDRSSAISTDRATHDRQLERFTAVSHTQREVERLLAGSPVPSATSSVLRDHRRETLRQQTETADRLIRESTTLREHGPTSTLRRDVERLRESTRHDTRDLRSETTVREGAQVSSALERLREAFRQETDATREFERTDSRTFRERGETSILFARPSLPGGPDGEPSYEGSFPGKGGVSLHDRLRDVIRHDAREFERIYRTTDRDHTSESTVDRFRERVDARALHHVERIIGREPPASVVSPGTESLVRERDRLRESAAHHRVERFTRDSETLRDLDHRASALRDRFLASREARHVEHLLERRLPAEGVRARDGQAPPAVERDPLREYLTERLSSSTTDRSAREVERQLKQVTTADSTHVEIDRLREFFERASRDGATVRESDRSTEYRITDRYMGPTDRTISTPPPDVVREVDRQARVERFHDRHAEVSRLVERALERATVTHEAAHFERVLAGRPAADRAPGLTVLAGTTPVALTPSWTVRPEWSATLTVPAAPERGGERFRDWLRERDTERHFERHVARLTEGPRHEWHVSTATVERSDRQETSRTASAREREIDRHLERILEGGDSTTALAEFRTLLSTAPPATVVRVRDWLREVERERAVLPTFAGRFERGGFIPPGQVGLVGDSRSGRTAPELVVRGRREEDFLTTTLGLVMPSHAPQIVGRSPDGRERPQLAYGGASGVTVIPLKRFAGAFADGGFIPPGSFGVVGDSSLGRVAPELLMPGRVSNTVTDNNETMVVNNHFHITAPAGTVSKPTELQIAAAAARGTANGKRRNL